MKRLATVFVLLLGMVTMAGCSLLGLGQPGSGAGGAASRYSDWSQPDAVKAGIQALGAKLGARALVAQAGSWHDYVYVIAMDRTEWRYNGTVTQASKTVTELTATKGVPLSSIDLVSARTRLTSATTKAGCPATFTVVALVWQNDAVSYQGSCTVSGTLIKQTETVGGGAVAGPVDLMTTQGTDQALKTCARCSPRARRSPTSRPACRPWRIPWAPACR